MFALYCIRNPRSTLQEPNKRKPTIDPTNAKVQCANPDCCLFVPLKGSLVHPATGLHACSVTCAYAIDAIENAEAVSA